jgi:hypothetical protein
MAKSKLKGGKTGGSSAAGGNRESMNSGPNSAFKKK